MPSILVAAGGRSSRSGLSETIDTVTAQYALRSLLLTVGEEATLAVAGGDAVVSFLRGIRLDEKPFILPLEDRVSAVRWTRLNQPEAIVVIGGDEHVLAVARGVIAAAPEALVLPVRSSGGSAAALFDASPGLCPSSLYDAQGWLEELRLVARAHQHGELAGPKFC